MGQATGRRFVETWRGLGIGPAAPRSGNKPDLLGVAMRGPDYNGMCAPGTILTSSMVALDADTRQADMALPGQPAQRV